MIMGSAMQRFYYGDAERKTSLGRDWHPTCLKCIECGRVLSPGQHAEHKGNPYCHTPCYKALFGPALLGYGSNIASPANFAKKDNAAEYGHDYDDDVYKRAIYSNSRTSAAARRQRQRRSAPPSIINHDFSALAKSPSTPSSTAAAGRQGVPVNGRVPVAASAGSQLGSVQEIAFTTAVISAPSSAAGHSSSVATQAGRRAASHSASGSNVPATRGDVSTNRANSVSQPAAPASRPSSSGSQASKAAVVVSNSQASLQHPAFAAGHGRSHSMVDPVPSVARGATADPPLPAGSSPQSNGSPTRVKSAAGKAKSKSVVGSSSPRHVDFAVSDSHEPPAHRDSAVTSSDSVSVVGNTVPSGNQVNNGRVPAVISVSSPPVLPHSAAELRPTHVRSRVAMTPALHDILGKVESFNGHFEGKVHHQMTVEQLPNGEVRVQGPLRIYWGLSRPIRLRQCDDVPAPPIAKWRHSLCANLADGAAQNNNTQLQKGPSTQSPQRPRFGVDDSILISPASGDEVVMRRGNIRKFNTVAYRHDAPTKWKRASINGHIFNYDTSVFTPVLGSSTSVIADSCMTTSIVIATLLDKFKVENSPGEYVLSVMMEKGEQAEERLLSDFDHPLLERLQLGADDQYCKIFLKERRLEPEVTVPDSVPLPIMEEEEEEEEMLPAEVEQLMILPVAVLKGIMVKYEKDEQKDLRLLKAKYERVKRKIRQRLEELRTA